MRIGHNAAVYVPFLPVTSFPFSPLVFPIFRHIFLFLLSSSLPASFLWCSNSFCYSFPLLSFAPFSCLKPSTLRFNLFPLFCGSSTSDSDPNRFFPIFPLVFLLLNEQIEISPERWKCSNYVFCTFFSGRIFSFFYNFLTKYIRKDFQGCFPGLLQIRKSLTYFKIKLNDKIVSRIMEQPIILNFT